MDKEAEAKKKKIVIDADLCISCGTCESISDGHKGGYFVQDPGDTAKVVKEYDEKDKAIVEDAIDSCASGAISLQ